MSAVWRASRAAVRRRRLQSIVIGLVVLCSTTTVVLALGLLAAASGPFDTAYAKQRGAHTVATYDTGKVSDAQLARTAHRPGVAAAAGPFRQAVVDVPGDWLWRPAGPLTVVGRADPGGPVDRIELLEGRWATAPGEIVVNYSGNGSPYRELLGTKLEAEGVPPLTVVGFATSMSKSAAAWVTPEQVAALHPTSAQMLYRFTRSATDKELSSGLAAATAELPEGSLRAAQTYLTLKQAFSSQADAYLPFMTLFGVLGLLVSALIVGNVVSGAVVSGYRHIGVLKALGFTPNQVVAVYLTMVSVPAVVGCVLGTALGHALAGPILKVAFSGIETGRASVGGIDGWVTAVSLVGMPALVLAAALLPALRAHRLPAAEAISAGGAPRTGRGLRVQRLLASTRLPRPVSLGLGQPFARPARTLLTTAAIVLGVTTVTLTTGLTTTMVAFGSAAQDDGGPRVGVETGTPGNGHTVPRLSDAQIEERLRSLPGAEDVVARGLAQVSLVGYTQPAFADFYRGDTSATAFRIVEGRRPEGAGEVAAGPGFLTQRGLAVGDRITLELNGRQAPATIVGKLIDGDARALESTWETFTRLDPDPRAIDYGVRLARGSDAHAYAEAVEAIDPGLSANVADSVNAPTATVVGFSSVFTLLLTVVASLGVFNTVLLNTRERRRDLGMLKSIGMTQRQVVAMTVTSVAGVGAVGGLLGIPLGVLAHRVVVDNVGVVAFPESMKDVWHAPQLTGLLLAGVVIAVLGALIPARSAARMTIATVLHTE
ncbi:MULTISPECIES: FtsX-like permease family protein [unclassified Streptomyces]|uniref:ABC transporter permease n=1 Tax=unclassified Streptomyces TaxID=2593676 RepID=UPI001BE74E10|nr:MULTISPECIES: FtsX-like permease family protein [unclassified Streptomyces]MBT2404232.1 FtsX-like permease family protein [Streptomyces sp. ISL-21]MBT2612909.1 FtsX-like permease family protein [Streptomyces sp. ISL-87]